MFLRVWLESLLIFLVIKDEKNIEPLKTHGLGLSLLLTFIVQNFKHTKVEGTTYNIFSSLYLVT